jgi:hypothetical protein
LIQNTLEGKGQRKRVGGREKAERRQNALREKEL